MLRTLTLIVITLALQGCYYMQAASGQWEVMRKREPIDAVIANPDTSGDIAERLRILDGARDFSIAELGLPDNKSYRTYADLEREFVVWNVFAAPEFSLQPRQWCYPVAGCVSYRGFFKKEKAAREAQKLRDDGFDVVVGGVSAYSTLGRFSDPVLNTMMRQEDIDLVALLFHELAHQVLYVKGDTAFNESFATAVEEFGVRRWLSSQNRPQEYGAYIGRREYQQRLMLLVQTAREDLQKLYESDVSIDAMREAKSSRFRQLATDAAEEAEKSDRESSGWLTDKANNAHLISTTLYEGRLPEFRALIAECNDDIHCFYARARELSEAQGD